MTSEETDIAAKIIMVVFFVCGFLLYLLSYDSPLTKSLEEASERTQQQRAEQRARELEQKTVVLSAVYPAWSLSTCQLVAAGRIGLGMTTDMVRISWGPPRDINRSVGAWGVHEQWVYGSYPYAQYLYFENGVLTSWQD